MKYLGYYDDERSAALVVDAFVREHRRDPVAWLNFPDMDPQVFKRELALAKDHRRVEQRSKPWTQSSKYIGVYWNPRKKVWIARMRHGKRHGGSGEKQALGYYDDERSAALAVDAFVREHMPGIVEKLNFPDMDPRDFARELAQVQRKGGSGAAAPSRKRPRSSPVVNDTATRPRLSDQPVPSTREERMLAIAASPTARALFRLATAHRSRKS